MSWADDEGYYYDHDTELPGNDYDNPFIWIPSKELPLLIADMEESHLNNAIAFLKRKGVFDPIEHPQHAVMIIEQRKRNER